MSSSKVIGLSGLARVGKDSFFSCAKDFLNRNGKSARRIALADPLKQEVDEFCKANYGISAMTTALDEKEIIRPLLVAHGFAKRRISNGRYFTSIAEKKIKSDSQTDIFFVTDVRYAEFELDEVFWLQNTMNGFLIHISRDGIVPPNPDEERNDPIIKNLSNFKIKVENFDNCSYHMQLQVVVDEFFTRNKDLWF